MNNSIERALERLASIDARAAPRSATRKPVHVVYGGAHLFRSNTFEKLGKLALASLEQHAPDFASFARAMWLKGADALPSDQSAVRDLEFCITDDPTKAREEVPEAVFAWQVFSKTVEKLSSEPVEEYRIDFEDGYGIRRDEEEDGHAVEAARQLAEYLGSENQESVGTGFRIKSFQSETRDRALRTLDTFVRALVRDPEKKLNGNVAVVLPKVRSGVETEVLSGLLDVYESEFDLTPGTFSIEVVIETPEGLKQLEEIIARSNGRCRSAHFGAYDYTSSLGIAAAHQHLRHKACDHARSEMQAVLAPLGVNLSDSVTIEMPIPVHRGDDLSITEIAENRIAVREAWRKHFNNVTYSQINGFYQSWDLHPAQLVARYAAVYAFFLESFDLQAERLRGFLEKATQAMTTGNLFDDLASAEGLLNFFLRGLACRAFTSDEVENSTGLSADEISTGSFVEIMQGRFSQSAP